MVFNKLPGWGAGFAAVVLLVGCGPPNYTPPPPSEPAPAKEALEKVLYSWRMGIEPSELAAAKPPIHVFDEDWKAKHRLMQYELLPGESLVGTSIRWPVRLRITRADGREEDVQVTYIISTNPVINVGRQED